MTRQALARQLDPASTHSGVPAHQLDDATAQMRRCPAADRRRTVDTLHREMLTAAKRGAGLPDDRPPTCWPPSRAAARQTRVCPVAGCGHVSCTNVRHE